MSMRAILYARVSRGSRQERARQLMNQLKECRDMARKFGWRVVAEMVENEGQTSGASWNLPKLDEMMEKAAAGSFDVLVVTEIDRLSRRLAKQVVIEQELSRLGIEIKYVNSHYPETSDGQLDKYIRAAIAEYEQTKNVERMIRGLRWTVIAGNVLTSSVPPYGYFRTNKDGLRKLSVLDDEADIVRLIYRWYTRGDSDFNHLGTISISRKLSQLWIPTASYNRGLGRIKKEDEWRHWNHKSVYNILASETYMGSWHYGKTNPPESGMRYKRDRDDWIRVEVPAIIDAGIWEKARRNRLFKRNRPGTKYMYLLKERLRCHRCDRILSITRFSRNESKKRQFRSFCRNAYGKNKTCDNGGSYQHLPLELAVLDWAYQQFGESSFRTFQDALREKYIIRIEDEMDTVHILTGKKIGQRRRLKRLFGEALIPAEGLQDRKRHMDHTIEALEKERIRLQSKLELVRSRWPEHIDVADPSYIYPREQNIDYIIRHALIEHLDISGIVGTIEGTKLAHIKSRLGQITFRIPNRIGKDTEMNARPVDVTSFGYRITSTGDLRKLDQ